MKATKVGKNPLGKQRADADKTTQTTVQTVSASHLAELETDSESKLENDQEQVNMTLLLIMERENE